MRKLRAGLKKIAILLGIALAMSGCGDKGGVDSASQSKDNALKDGVEIVVGSIDRKMEDFRGHMGSSNPMGESDPLGNSDHMGNGFSMEKGFPMGPNISGEETPPDYHGYAMTPDYDGFVGDEESFWQYGSLYGGRDGNAQEPTYSYDGLLITIDGNVIDFSLVAPAVNAITDVQRVGDWLIFVGHVNPNMNIYGFYNVNKAPTPEFDMEIAGTNLIWQENDLSTAVYLSDNVIYGLWGNEIGTTDDGVINELSFKDSNTIEARCSQKGQNGSAPDTVLEFKYEPRDRAVLLYYEFLLGGSRQWPELQAEEPENALLLVIVNPPEVVRQKMIVQFDFEENASDAIAVIGLKDFQQIHIEKSDRDTSQNQMNAIGMSGMGKSEAVLYKMNIPDDEARYTLFVKGGKDGKASFDIKRNFDEGNRMSKFILAGE